MNELELIMEALRAVQEAGRVLSASNRTRVESLKSRLGGLDYHPAVGDAIKLCDELLALSDTAPAEPVEEAAPASTEEPLSESVHIVEAAPGDKSGRQWDVVLIEAGRSQNGRYYPTDTLRKATPLFEGAFAYANHQSEADRRAGLDRNVKDKVGRFRNATYGTFNVDGRVTEGIRARFTVVAPWLRETLREAVDSGEPDFLGFSIDALGEVEARQVEGRTSAYVKSIRSVRSVDVVSNPAAGGRIERLVASQGSNNTMKCRHCQNEFDSAELLAEHLSEAISAPPAGPDSATILAKLEQIEEERRREKAGVRLSESLAAAKLTEVSRGRLRKTMTALIEAGKAPNDDEIATAITEAQEEEAALAAAFNKPYSAGRVENGASDSDNKQKRLARMFESSMITHDDGIRPFRSLKEAYCQWTGADPFEVNPLDIVAAFATKYDSRKDHTRVQESLATSSWGEVYADNLYVKMISTYRTLPYMTEWQSVVSDIEDVPDFQTRHWVRTGGYGNLSTVNEQQTYPTLTSPTDEEVTYAIAKRGGIDDVTFESIINDRFGAIRRIPEGMARAAARTLHRFVFNLVTTTNPTMDYDSVALYHASHSNTSAVALTTAGLDTVQALMRDQTAYNESSEILGARNRPKILIVPNELEMRARRVVNPSVQQIANDDSGAGTDTNIDPTAFSSWGINVIAYDVLTDANDWYAIADPREVPTMVVGFLQGNREPQLFVQDMPNVGSTFDADKISYKVRHIYGGDILEHRSFYWATQ